MKLVYSISLMEFEDIGLTLHKEIRKKNEMKQKRSGSMTRAKASNYTAGVWSKTMCKNIEEISGKKTCSSIGFISSKRVTAFWIKKKNSTQTGRVPKCIFRRPQKGLQCNEAQFCLTTIMKLKDDIRAAIRKMKLGKATGPVELVAALEDYGIDKITTLINGIYGIGQISPEISKSILIALPKKLGATECELHRMISLMSHITKSLLRIIMMCVK